MMIYLEAYGDFIGKGSFNNVTEIDKDWVLKQPKPRKDLEPDWKDIDIKGEFSRHIGTMKKYPEIFAQVKKLSDIRAAIERLDTKKAQDETYYVVDWGGLSDVENIYKFLYKDSNIYLKRKKETFDKVVSITKSKNKYRK